MSFQPSYDLSGYSCWPFNGFAPGGYSCFCSVCQKQHVADKRSSKCLECAVKNSVDVIIRLEKDIQGMSQELQNADVEIANPKEQIVAAAVYHGCTFSLPPPARHGHILALMGKTLGIDTIIPPENQGFLTSFGRFVSRVEAKQIAYRAKQEMIESGNKGDPELYSEDLW